MNQQIIVGALSNMIMYFEADPRRSQHSLKVHNFSRVIGHLEGLSDEEIHLLELAAIFHDIGIKESEAKYQTADFHPQEGPTVTRVLLAEFGLPESQLETICHMVEHHHEYGKPHGTPLQILIEADFLVNIFEGNIHNLSVQEIEDKFFETKTGISYLRCMYGNAYDTP